MEEKVIYKVDGTTHFGPYGITISILKDPLRPLSVGEREAVEKAGAAIRYAVGIEQVRSNPKEMELAAQERVDLTIVLFGDRAIYVADVPNGYCADWCCVHRPWFRVFTKLGPIEVGWRKSVINIDWSGTLMAHYPKFYGHALFPDEDVTRGDHFIHAHGLERARKYIDRLLSQDVSLYNGKDAK